MLLWPFNKYPGTDYETFNWEWILKTVKDWVATMTEFVRDMTDAWNVMRQQWVDYQDDLNDDWRNYQDDLNDQWQEFIDDTYKDQITEILENHPEWVTTVMDGAITKPKINVTFLQEIENCYVTPEMFGAVGDGLADDTNAMAAAFNRGGIVVLKKDAVYKIDSLHFPDSNGLVISEPTIIIGNNANLMVYDTYDYQSLIYSETETILTDVTITERNEHLTSDTGSAEQKDRKTIWIRNAAGHIEGVVINNAIGVHQILLSSDNKPSNITRCEINFAESPSVSYDRTMIYLEDGNIICENNRLNSNGKAHTAIETHGANIIVCNNKCVNTFETGIYITNTETADNVILKNNYLSCLRGIVLWFSTNNPVGNISIENNTIEQTSTGNYYVINLYDVYNAESVKKIIVTGNILRQLNSGATHQPIYINPSRGSGGAIRMITFRDNWIVCGTDTYVFELNSNSHNTFTVNNIDVNNNTIDCGGAQLAHIISPDGRLNNIKFANNLVNNNSVQGAANMSITTALGYYDFIDNVFENTLIRLVAGNGTVNTRFYGSVNIDLRSAPGRGVLVAEITALNGDHLVTRGTRINKELAAADKLTGTDIYTTGDIIWNSEPVIGEPIGWVSLDHDNFRPFGVINQN